MRAAIHPREWFRDGSGEFKFAGGGEQNGRQPKAPLGIDIDLKLVGASGLRGRRRLGSAVDA